MGNGCCNPQNSNTGEDAILDKQLAINKQRKLKSSSNGLDVVIEEGIPSEFLEVSILNQTSYKQFVTEGLALIGKYQGLNNPYSEKMVLKGNEALYMGQYNPKSGTAEGMGKMELDGNYFEGIFVNNKLGGAGRCLIDGDMLQGTFKNGIINGKGIMKTLEGCEYTGDFKNGERHGLGEEKWDDGTYYIGEFKNGEKDVKGRFIWPNQGSEYEGELKNGNLSGKGKYKWEDGKIYEGEWLEGKMHGKGKFFWRDGRKYIGDYKKGLKDGYGEFLYPDNRKVCGNWKGGKLEGKVKKYSAEGKLAEVEYKNGKEMTVFVAKENYKE